MAAAVSVCSQTTRSCTNIRPLFPPIRSGALTAHGSLPSLGAPGPGEGAPGRDPRAATARLPQGLPPLPVMFRLGPPAQPPPPGANSLSHTAPRALDRRPRRGRKSRLPFRPPWLPSRTQTALDTGPSAPLLDLGRNPPHAVSQPLLGKNTEDKLLP